MKFLFILPLLALAAYGQQREKIAIINTVDDGEPQLKPLELSHLTNKLREIAGNVLPDKSYDVMTEEYIVDFSGSQEEAEKKCEASDGCLAKLGRDIKVHYIAQGRIGRFGSDLTIKAELYSTKSSKLVSSLVSSSKDIYGLLSELEKKAPDMFKKMLPQQPVPQPQTASPQTPPAPATAEVIEPPRAVPLPYQPAPAPVVAPAPAAAVPAPVVAPAPVARPAPAAAVPAPVARPAPAPVAVPAPVARPAPAPVAVPAPVARPARR